MATKRILCFGDSLTWGHVPDEEGKPVTRYPFGERWTGVLSAQLGAEVEIIEEGLSSRTTNIDDPLDSRLNGANYLPATLGSHAPLDLVIIMLGTNDTKGYLQRTPYDIARGMQQLVGQVKDSQYAGGTAYPAPQVLVVSPPPLGPLDQPWFADMFDGGTEKSQQLASRYRTLAKIMGVAFFDAGSVISTDGVDGIHFTRENNRELGEALAAQVKPLLSA
ncbi:SGNH/GDSL hydrolase family protein [Carnimonas bestiolae]|uniref:SGNH/GDSL hydrolase family protein n=1 Tax=Carnimonas bestiolae TaxID=3402172 RepID=UPI003EDBF108